MPEGNEKRRDLRVPFVLRVEYPGIPRAVRDCTENLSAGGLFIRTDRPLSEGDRLSLQVSFPGLLPPLAVEVEVVRRRPASAGEAAGVAVRVPADRPEDRARLAALVGAARDARPRRRGAFRVLVVEDDGDVVEMYEYALHRLRAGKDRVDLQVEYAVDGQRALERLAASPPIDLVLTDVFMPVLDGFEMIERLRADPRLSHTPVMVLSAGGPDARARAMSAGADAYLQKPVQFGDVLSTVRALLQAGD